MPDKWFKRWGKSTPGPWSYSDMEEMIREMEKEFTELEKMVPKELVHETKAADGSISKEIGPIVYGYSLSIGPDGKPEVKEFGNLKRGPPKAWYESVTETREPHVEIVEGDHEIRVIAELPGASRETIKISGRGRRLVLSTDKAPRKYRKELQLPAEVDARTAVSKFNNGILELVLPKRTK